MPSYDYHCAANGQTLEVKHRMSQKLTSWGEVCEALGIDTGETPADAPVERVITSSGGVVSAGATKNPEAPPCMSGGGCPGGSCGI